MFKNKRIVLVLSTALFVMLIALQHFSPKPIDWRLTYNTYTKSPYSCYVMNDMLGSLFPNQQIRYNNQTFYVSLDTNKTEPQNLVVVTSSFNPDSYDGQVLWQYVKNGNNLFVSASEFEAWFLDSLNIKLNDAIIDTSVFKAGDEIVYLENQALKSDSGYHYNRRMPLLSFASYDTLNSVVLGTNRIGDPNFLRIGLGKGEIYLHTQPFVFTNYHLLYGNIDYASKVLSYLPVQKTTWDNYYKPDRLVNTSPTRYILSQPPLQIAFYILLLTLVLYMVIESKRRQRIIPVIKPPENRSLQFVKTVGSLYFKQHDNTDLAKKKIIYFKEFIRERYYISSLSPTSDCINHVAAKSGLPAKQIKQLLESVTYFETSKSVSDGGLVQLNHRMELFYEQCL